MVRGCGMLLRRAVQDLRRIKTVRLRQKSVVSAAMRMRMLSHTNEAGL
jgi:hypothetical protein